MATTDIEIEAHAGLANFAYDLKEQYNQTHGLSRESFINLHKHGEIQLSTVYENLLVAARNSNNIPTQKVSEYSRDFSNDGDMKIGVLKKDSDARRFCISNVANKVGTIYFVGWNWLKNSPNFFAIPKPVDTTFPQCGIKIIVHPVTGEKTRSKYNAYSYNSFEEMACADYDANGNLLDKSRLEKPSS